MNYINFESAKKKEKEGLREAREEMSVDAKNVCILPSRESEHALKEQKRMLPNVPDKKPKQKKSKKSKKKREINKLKKRKRRHCHDSSINSNSSSENELVSGSSTESSSNKHVEKRRQKKKIKDTKFEKHSFLAEEKAKSGLKDEKGEIYNVFSSSFDRCTNSEKDSKKRDSWMTNNNFTLKTFSRDHVEKKPFRIEQQQQSSSKYDPTKSCRELNPFWKTTGTGLPTFKKPTLENYHEDPNLINTLPAQYTTGQKNWKKLPASCGIGDGLPSKLNSLRSPSSPSSPPIENNESAKIENTHLFTDQEMNELGARLIKAEIMGNSNLVMELKNKLERARQSREQNEAPLKGDIRKMHKRNKQIEHILLTHTDKHGNSRPLSNTDYEVNKRNAYEEHTSNKNKKTERLGTHIDGKRCRYYIDDDKYDIKKMFEREKYLSSADTNMEFANLACKHKNMSDDMDDIFVDKIRQSKTELQTKKTEQRVLNEQYRFHEQLDNCDKCLDSTKMDKNLIVSIGKKVYLALPWYKGLQTGHCIITTTQHVSCSTQTDEDTWSEINDFRKALLRMFAARRNDVIFFEVANKFHRHPHLEIHCIPIPERKAELAPFYFKKAIEESEMEWSVNKQLISLSRKSLRNSVPKSLPYFWVAFGLNDGFAHVIEDQDRFPSNFAMEIIGGMLHLESNTWRRPIKEKNIIDKVKKFGEWWEKYDCTVLV